MLGTTNITSMPATNKSLSISLNGAGTVIYDGSEIKSLNITAASIGAALASHNHDTLYSKLIHTHTAAQVGAAADDHTHTAASIGAAPATHNHDAVYAKTSHTHTAASIGAITAADVEKTYAKKTDLTPLAKTADIEAGYAKKDHTHTAASIGAAPATHNHTAAQVGAAPTSHTHIPAQVGAAPANLLLTGKTITTANWNATSKIYELVDARISSNDIPQVFFNTASLEVAAKAGIIVYTETGKLIFKCTTIPTASITAENIILVPTA